MSNIITKLLVAQRLGYPLQKYTSKQCRDSTRTSVCCSCTVSSPPSPISQSHATHHNKHSFCLLYYIHAVSIGHCTHVVLDYLVYNTLKCQLDNQQNNCISSIIPYTLYNILIIVTISRVVCMQYLTYITACSLITVKALTAQQYHLQWIDPKPVPKNTHKQIISRLCNQPQCNQ